LPAFPMLLDSEEFSLAAGSEPPKRLLRNLLKYMME